VIDLIRRLLRHRSGVTARRISDYQVYWSGQRDLPGGGPADAFVGRAMMTEEVPFSPEVRGLHLRGRWIWPGQGLVAGRRGGCPTLRSPDVLRDGPHS